MDSDPLVRHVDPLRDSRTRLVVRSSVLAVRDFLLQRRPEAFRHGVVIAVAGTTYAFHGHRAYFCRNGRMQRVQMYNPLILQFHAPNTHARSSRPSVVGM